MVETPVGILCNQAGGEGGSKSKCAQSLNTWSFIALSQIVITRLEALRRDWKLIGGVEVSGGLIVEKDGKGRKEKLQREHILNKQISPSL